MTRGFVGLVLIAAACSALAEVDSTAEPTLSPIAFDIKGLALSVASVSDLKGVFPVVCKPTEKTISVWQAACGLRENRRVLYGDVMIQDALFLIADGRMHTVLMDFKAADFDRLKELLQMKFGEPECEVNCSWLRQSQQVVLQSHQTHTRLKFLTIKISDSVSERIKRKDKIALDQM
jgi:hypothetical protein